MVHADEAPKWSQQIIELSLTAPTKHGRWCWEDVMPVLMPDYEQLQLGPNFFQAPAPSSHSTRLTFVFRPDGATCPANHQTVALLPPNMDDSIGQMPCLFSCPFLSN
jgi:hypothetical protein